jgi:hypothetical protein
MALCFLSLAREGPACVSPMRRPFILGVNQGGIVPISLAMNEEFVVYLLTARVLDVLELP